MSSKREIKRLAAILLLSVLLAGAWSAWRNYQGYCAGDTRLSDEEKIRLAVEHVMNRHAGVVGAADALMFRQYKTADEFLAANPGCCAMEASAHGEQVSLIDRVTGYGTAYVHVRARPEYVSYIGVSARAEEQQWSVIVSNCGRAWRE